VGRPRKVVNLADSPEMVKRVMEVAKKMAQAYVRNRPTDIRNLAEEAADRSRHQASAQVKKVELAVVVTIFDENLASICRRQPCSADRCNVGFEPGGFVVEHTHK
jgi:hypothetical protein